MACRPAPREPRHPVAHRAPDRHRTVDGDEAKRRRGGDRVRVADRDLRRGLEGGAGRGRLSGFALPHAHRRHAAVRAGGDERHPRSPGAPRDRARPRPGAPPADAALRGRVRAVVDRSGRDHRGRARDSDGDGRRDACRCAAVPDGAGGGQRRQRRQPVADQRDRDHRQYQDGRSRHWRAPIEGLDRQLRRAPAGDGGGVRRPRRLAARLRGAAQRLPRRRGSRPVTG